MGAAGSKAHRGAACLAPSPAKEHLGPAPRLQEYMFVPSQPRPAVDFAAHLSPLTIFLLSSPLLSSSYSIMADDRRR